MNIVDLQTYYASLSIEEREALDDEGLCMHEQLAPGGYASSPRGYLAFASTGGNGVHFSFASDQAGPVVMTVPMAFDCPNVVVGSNLQDFLSLGCIFGYFRLEGLAYDIARTSSSVESAEGQHPALRDLSEQFNLRPWQDVGRRLATLKLACPLEQG